MSLINVNLPELKVLVIDDSSATRHILREFLDSLGVVQTAVAEDGADAIARLRSFPADVALTELHTAPVDGIEFTRLLRNADDSPNPYLPILMMTADATEAQVTNAIKAGVNDFMAKPIKLDAVRRKLHLLFSRPMVFLSDGRSLRPFRRFAQSELPAAPNGARAPTVNSKPAPKGEPIDYSVPGMDPLTRNDLGSK